MAHQVQRVAEVVVARIDGIIDRVEERLVHDFQAARTQPVLRPRLLPESIRNHQRAGGITEVLLRVPDATDLPGQALLRESEVVQASGRSQASQVGLDRIDVSPDHFARKSEVVVFEQALCDPPEMMDEASDQLEVVRASVAALGRSLACVRIDFGPHDMHPTRQSTGGS